MPTMGSRRHFLSQLGIAGAAGLGGLGAVGTRLFAAEAPPEITTIRFEEAVTCIAPQVFQELLRAEGFTEIRYVDEADARVRRADAAKSSVLSDMIATGRWQQNPPLEISASSAPYRGLAPLMVQRSCWHPSRAAKPIDLRGS